MCGGFGFFRRASLHRRRSLRGRGRDRGRFRGHGYGWIRSGRRAEDNRSKRGGRGGQSRVLAGCFLRNVNVNHAVAGSDGDAFLSRDGRFTAAVGDRSVEIDTRRMRIGGLHNAYNAMAAALATLAAGVAPAKIRKSLYAFAPVEHRLEPVAEKDGVLWINDSKATNVDSVYYALESMTRPVVWIAGGTDKGNDYEPLKAFARAKVHTLVCMGLDNAKLVREFTGVVPEVVSTDSLEAAMTASKAAARPGDAVLLSPACASFDLFRNYENRGELFKNWVEEKA